MFVFIVSFVLMLKPEVELFGICLFLTINLLFCVFTANDAMSIKYKPGVPSLDPNAAFLQQEKNVKFCVLLASLAFSFVSSIFLIMTLATLQRKFATNNTGIKLSTNYRADLDKTKIIFIAATCFIGVVALYTYYSADEVRRLTYLIFNTILNGRDVIWMRVLFPIAILGVGAALYGQLMLDKIQVNKTPEKNCYPGNDQQMSSFRDNFVKTFWLLVSYVILVLARPFIESSYLFGSMMGNRFNPRAEKGAPDPYLFGVNPKTQISPFAPLVALASIIGIDLSFLNNFKFVFRWDIFYQLAVYGLSLTGLVFASFTLRDYMGIPADHNCLMRDAFIRQLFIAFIFFVVVLYTLNTFSAFQLTTVITGVMRYFVPPTALALSSYLVYITNNFSKLSPQLLVE